MPAAIYHAGPEHSITQQAPHAATCKLHVQHKHGEASQEARADAPRLRLLAGHWRRLCFVHGVLSYSGARLTLLLSKVSSGHGGIQIPAHKCLV